MSFSDFANFVGRRAAASGKAGLVKAYDDLAGSRLLRPAARADAVEKAPWRDPAARTVAAPAKPEAEDKLGRQLREFYQSLSREPVPERFAQLIADLEAGKKR